MINKIIDLAKKINNTSVIMKYIVSVSQIKDIAFLPEVYLFLYYEDEKTLAQQYLDKFEDNNLINKFIITHTLISSSDDMMSSNIKKLVTSYNQIFSNKHFFVCNNCGYKSNELNWLCPSCNSWETIYPKSAIDLLKEGDMSESK
jgi:lipopolysaccharide biosynthesis regulator YciM